MVDETIEVAQEAEVAEGVIEAAEAAAEPAAEAAAEPVAEAAAEPVAEVAAEPIAEVAAEPVAEVAAEPVAEVAAEPVAEAAAEPVAEAAAEPVAEAAAEPAAEAAAEPAVEEAAEPAAEAAAEPVAEAAELTGPPTSPGQLKRKMKITGTVKRTELYGAFIDIGVGIDAIIHVSQLGKGGKRVKETLKVGEEVDVWVDKVDADRGQVIVTMIEPLAVDWSDLKEGQAYKGTIKRLENFGAFVDIGAEKEGLVHISEMSHDFIRHPSQAVEVGQEVDVQVLTFSKRKRRINLSIKALLDAPEAKEVEAYIEEVFEIEEEEDEDVPTAMEIALRRAMGKDAPMPIRGRKKNKRSRRSKRERRRRMQNDIISRTLELSEDH